MQRNNYGPRALEHRHKPAKNFEFITISDPVQSRTSAAWTLVRKHAMRNVIERSRSLTATKKPDTPKEVPQHVEGLPYLAPRPTRSDSQTSSSSGSDGQVTTGTQSSATSLVLEGEDTDVDGSSEDTILSGAVPGLVTSLGAGRIDPFANYPSLSKDPQMDGVIDYCM